MSQDFQQQSDGYHTFAELYQHRYALFLALMRSNPAVSWFSARHHDGKIPFGNPEWFIAGMTLDPIGAITYHLPSAYWGMAACTGATLLELAPEWDGHTSADVIRRLEAWATILPGGVRVNA